MRMRMRMRQFESGGGSGSLVVFDSIEVRFLMRWYSVQRCLLLGVFSLY